LFRVLETSLAQMFAYRTSTGRVKTRTLRSFGMNNPAQGIDRAAEWCIFGPTALSRAFSQ
jgi:hypothetical protein